MLGQKIFEQFVVEFKVVQEEVNVKVKVIVEEVFGKVKVGEVLLEKLKGDVDDVLIKMNDLVGQVIELVQKLVCVGGDGDCLVLKLFGEQFVDFEGFKFWVDGCLCQGKFDMVVKVMIIIVCMDVFGLVGVVMDCMWLFGFVDILQWCLVVCDFILQGCIDQVVFEYICEKGFINNVGMVVEGVKKLEFDVQLELILISVKVIVYWMKVLKQVLSDVL